jgi:hypothetical protein
VGKRAHACFNGINKEGASSQSRLIGLCHAYSSSSSFLDCPDIVPMITPITSQSFYGVSARRPSAGESNGRMVKRQRPEMRGIIIDAIVACTFVWFTLSLGSLLVLVLLSELLGVICLRVLWPVCSVMIISPLTCPSASACRGLVPLALSPFIALTCFARHTPCPSQRPSTRPQTLPKA